MEKEKSFVNFIWVKSILQFLHWFSNELFLILFPESEEVLFLQKVDFKKLARQARIYQIKAYKTHNIKQPTKIFFLFKYDAEIKKIIWALKFRRKSNFADFLGKVLAENLEKILEESCNYKKNIKETFFNEILLIPIPIHKKRFQERGFNQCELVCQKLIENYKPKTRNSPKLIYHPDILIRTKYTTKQSWSNEKERIENIKGVFEISKGKHHLLENKKIILIDDVTTTGSTLIEAIKTLKSPVIAIAIAH